MLVNEWACLRLQVQFTVLELELRQKRRYGALKACTYMLKKSSEKNLSVKTEFSSLQVSLYVLYFDLLEA